MKNFKSLKIGITICLSIIFHTAQGQCIANDNSLLASNSFEIGSSSLSTINLPILKKELKIKDPKKATLLAVFLPGSGQIYNEKYWKVPIVYAGLGISAYAIFWNKREMKGFQDELDSRLKDTLVVNYQNLTIDQLKSNRDFYRSNRDLSIMSFTLIYALQILDAAVDAHLSEYSLGDDLTLRIEPKRYQRTNLGLGLTLTF